MKRIGFAVLLLLAVGLSSGCGQRQVEAADKATSQQPPTPPESAQAPQPVADSCFALSTESQEQTRIEFAEMVKDKESEEDSDNLALRVVGHSHEYLTIITSSPSWGPQEQTVAQKWSTEYRRDTFKPKFQKMVCDAGFSRIGILVMVPKPSGGRANVHVIYKADVTKRGFVPVSTAD